MQTHRAILEQPNTKKNVMEVLCGFGGINAQTVPESPKMVTALSNHVY